MKFLVVLCISMFFIRLQAAISHHYGYCYHTYTLQRRRGATQWKSGSNGPSVWVPVVNIRARPAYSNGFSQHLACVLLRMSSMPAGSVDLFCLSSLSSMTKSKIFYSEVELFKHLLALNPVPFLSGPFPKALCSLLTCDSQSLVKEK